MTSSTPHESDSPIPPIGVGTWQNDDPEECAATVRTALELGYRHVDTASVYGNETAVGRGIAVADVPRDEVVVATKVWHDSLAYDDVVESVRASRNRLGLEAIDIAYVHWPCFSYDPEETLPALERLRDEGLIRHIGLSNFTVDHLKRALDVLQTTPVANQVELHPLLPQPDLVSYCHDVGIRPVAYSPLIHGRAFEVDILSDIADEHGVSVPKVVLRWLQSKDVTPIPKATGEDHLRDNLESTRLTLPRDDIERIDAIKERERISRADWTPF